MAVSSPRKNVATTKTEKKDLPRSVAVNTLEKVDDTVNLKKCTKAKDRGRKKRIGDTNKSSTSNEFVQNGIEKSTPCGSSTHARRHMHVCNKSNTNT